MSSSSYPIRAVWRINPHRKNEHAQFLISVPKKKLRHAVDRVKMRRRIREAYRLYRHNLHIPEHTAIDIAFIYQINNLTDYASIEHSMIKLLGKISGILQAQKKEGDETCD